jgi:hypothetical protein
MQRRNLLVIAVAALAAVAVFSLRFFDRTALAQEKPQPAAKQPSPTSPASEVEQNDVATRAKLSQRMPMEFIETPVSDVIEFLSDALDVEFYVNWKKVEALGLPKDVPVTLQLARVSGGMALELALDQAGPDQLAYVIRDGVVIISTVDDLDGAAMLQVYNCRDLLSQSAQQQFGAGLPGMPAGMMMSSLGGYGGGAGPGAAGGSPYGAPGMAGGPGMGPPGGGMGMGSSEGAMGGGAGYGGPPTSSTEADRLVNILMTSIAPSSWQAAGGTGTIAEYNGLIVVNHNARVHAQVEQLLKMLRQAAASGQ